MREIAGISTEEMAEKTEVSVEEYKDYEAGKMYKNMQEKVL